MSPATTADKWKSKINRDFPNGLLMVWKGSEQSESAPLYRIWKVDVVGMEGLDPVVELRVFDVPKTFVGKIVSYNKVQDQPLMVEVKFEDMDTSMVWSGNISPELAEIFKAGPVAI